LPAAGLVSAPNGRQECGWPISVGGTSPPSGRQNKVTAFLRPFQRCDGQAACEVVEAGPFAGAKALRRDGPSLAANPGRAGCPLPRPGALQQEPTQRRGNSGDSGFAGPAAAGEQPASVKARQDGAARVEGWGRAGIRQGSFAVKARPSISADKVLARAGSPTQRGDLLPFGETKTHTRIGVFCGSRGNGPTLSARDRKRPKLAASRR